MAYQGVQTDKLRGGGETIYIRKDVQKTSRGQKVDLMKTNKGHEFDGHVTLEGSQGTFGGWPLGGWTNDISKIGI